MVFVGHLNDLVIWWKVNARLLFCFFLSCIIYFHPILLLLGFQARNVFYATIKLANFLSFFKTWSFWKLYFCAQWFNCHDMNFWGKKISWEQPCLEVSYPESWITFQVPNDCRISFPFLLFLLLALVHLFERKSLACEMSPTNLPKQPHTRISLWVWNNLSSVNLHYYNLMFL